MEIIKSTKKMRDRANELKRGGKNISLVPTMGALHEGHLSLVDIGKKEADISVMSVYLNPIQFGEGEDLSNYPSNLERDIELAKSRGVDIVFCPTNKDIYPEGFETYTENTGLSKTLCGASRPGHFRGVTTIVLKLFNIVKPDVAVFGQKDYQQLKIIEKMVEDLNIDVKIIPAPIVREKDGLAMSSRNAYLKPQERLAAKSINQALNLVEKLVTGGEYKLDKLTGFVKSHIESTGIGKIDYVKICDPETLQELKSFRAPALLAIAAGFGGARLIDNRILKI